jgi:capsular exopolysaccharide synthesis family protein
MGTGALNIEEHDPSNPREVFRRLWRRRSILLLCITLIPLGTYLYSAQLTKSYESTTVLQIQAIGDATDVVTDTSSSGTVGNASVARLAETTGVADEAARRLRFPEGSLRGKIQGSSDEDTGFITLTATWSTAKGAAEIANAAARALNSTREERGVERANEAIAAIQEDLSRLSPSGEDATEHEQLSEKLQRLRTLRAAQGSNAQVIEPATVPGAPVSPNPRRNALLALILAMLAGIGLVILVDRMDRRLRDASEIEKLVGLPLLAVISKDAFPGGRPSHSHALAFQTLRDSLTYFNVDETLRTIAITSPLKGEGKTTVATHLAASLARANKDVILVDADLRKPQVGTRMGLHDESHGLSSVLLGAPLEETLHELPSYGSRLKILPAGPKPPNPSELIGSKRMSALLEELTELADVVVIDTPPLLVVSDAFPLLEQVSGTVGLARLDHTPRDAVQRMVEITTTAGGRVFGMVATGAKGGSLGYDYGYGYLSEAPATGVGSPGGENGSAPTGADAGDDGDARAAETPDGTGAASGGQKRGWPRAGG